MTIQRLTAFALGVLLTGAPFAASAADNSPALAQIVGDVQRVRQEAQEIRQLLRPKAPDFALVQQRLVVLGTLATALRQNLAGFDIASAALSDTQKHDFERAKGTTDVLHVLLTHKTDLLAGTAEASHKRSMLRAQADGIVKRADLVEQLITRVRG